MTTLENKKLCCEAVVIGGGLTGLSAAYSLQKAGKDVLLLDQSELPGGAVRTSSRDGYLVEAGPNTLLLNDRRVADLITELGLDNRMVEASPEAKKRFLVRDGRTVPAPMSPVQFIRTPLFSSEAKWRLLGEPFRPRGRNEEESLGDFVRRRLGPEVLERAVQPLISGIYAGDPDRLAVSHAFPALAQMEQDHGSLFRAGLARMRNRSPHKMKRSLISFRSGLAELPLALARQLGPGYLGGMALRSMRRQAGTSGWTLQARSGEAALTIQCEQIFSAVPSFALKDLPWPAEVAASMIGLDGIPYAPVTVAALGFSREATHHPLDGFGALIPEIENLPVLGALFSSTLFPGRAPDGKVLLTCFLGGRLHPERAEGTDQEIVDRALAGLKHVVGVQGTPEFVQIHRWPRAIPQMEIGYGRFFETMDQIEEHFPGLKLLGNFRHGISAPQCLLAGMDC